jgi:uncharacterized protein YbjQ (UPF0145 family)
MQPFNSRKPTVKKANNQVTLACSRLKTIKKSFGMIVTTTPSIDGKSITAYLGVISSETIIGANIFKDILGGLRDVFGGRSGTYEKVLEEAKEYAMQELVEKARAAGADAVVGIDLDYETVGANGSMLMVSASGTAVKLR